MTTSYLERKIQASIVQGMYVSEKVLAFREKALKRQQEKQRKALEESQQQSSNHHYVKGYKSTKPVILSGNKTEKAGARGHLAQMQFFAPGVADFQSVSQQRGGDAVTERDQQLFNDSMISFQNSKLDSSRARITDVQQISFSTQPDHTIMVMAPSPSAKSLNLLPRMGSNKQQVMQAVLFVIMAASGGNLPEALKAQKRDIVSKLEQSNHLHYVLLLKNLNRPGDASANQSFEFKGLYARSNLSTLIPAIKKNEILQSPSANSSLTKILGKTTPQSPAIINESMIEQQFTFEKSTKRMLEIASGQRRLTVYTDAVCLQRPP